VILSGFFLGWFLCEFKIFVKFSYSSLKRKLFFSLSFMWFLVFLTRQGVLKNSLNLGSHFLYQSDRGWLEFFGGSGLSALLFKFFKFLANYRFNSILTFLGVIIFFRGIFFLAFVYYL